MKKKLTPLEKLQTDKLHCKEKIGELEIKLNENFSYIQKNAGGLVLSSFSSLLFKNNKSNNTGAHSNSAPLALPSINSKLSLADYLLIGKDMLPYIWSISKPLLITWGIGKTQSILFNALFGKRKKR